MHQFHKIYFGMKLYIFRRVRLSVIRSLFTVHSAMVYVIQVCRLFEQDLVLLKNIHTKNALRMRGTFFVWIYTTSA
jgi:hypothetical protein